MNNITQERLKELLHYDPDTGVFLWIKKNSRKISIGKVAGHIDKQGYWVIGIDKKQFFAHRLAWLYVFGEFPNGLIDHMNRNKTDNRIHNLRVATNSENGQNHKIQKNNTSGITGVFWCKKAKKWRARVKINKKYKNLGSFHTMEEAKEARKVAEKEFYSLPD